MVLLVPQVQKVILGQLEHLEPLEPKVVQELAGLFLPKGKGHDGEPGRRGAPAVALDGINLTSLEAHEHDRTHVHTLHTPTPHTCASLQQWTRWGLNPGPPAC